jgi:hypothetical protein
MNAKGGMDYFVGMVTKLRVQYWLSGDGGVMNSAFFSKSHIELM